MIPNRTFQWTNDQSWKYRAEIEVIVNKWLIVILMMGHSRDQSLDGNVRNQTLIDCSCDLNWSQNNNPEEQIQELWSSNSIRENDNQVFWFFVCLNIRIHMTNDNCARRKSQKVSCRQVIDWRKFGVINPSENKSFWLVQIESRSQVWPKYWVTKVYNAMYSLNFSMTLSLVSISKHAITWRSEIFVNISFAHSSESVKSVEICS